MKYNGGIPKDALAGEDVEAVKRGGVNLEAHIENLKKFGVPVVVAVNRFHTDTDKELEAVRQICDRCGALCAMSEVFAKGGAGGIELAQAVVEACEEPSCFAPIYGDDLTIQEKIEKIATTIYGAQSVQFDAAALKSIEQIIGLDPAYGKFPVCMAKTQYSLSDDPAKLGRPQDFDITVREVRLSAGAGFIVALTGAIMTMPGLPKVPAACKMDVDDKGNITGLF